MKHFRLYTAILLGLTIPWFVGCKTTSSETASRDTLTVHVGNYSSPPSGLEKARVGIPTFQSDSLGAGNVTRIQISNKANNLNRDVDKLAADQLTTLIFKTRRFDVVERAQLDKLIKEQELEGIVKSSELAKAGQVRGVDYLLLGKVTNLRVKKEKTSTGFGLGDISGVGRHFIKELGGVRGSTFDVKNDKTVVKVECGVDLRLVEPSSGRIVAADFGEYKRTDSVGSMGLKLLGGSAQANADLEISESDKGKILRLALDDALRKMLPVVDDELMSRLSKGSSAEKKTAPAAAAKSPSSKKSFCSGCGSPVGANAKFCGGCGKKVGE